jgi:hypothetical protein
VLMWPGLVLTWSSSCVHVIRGEIPWSLRFPMAPSPEGGVYQWRRGNPHGHWIFPRITWNCDVVYSRTLLKSGPQGKLQRNPMPSPGFCKVAL